MKPASNNLVVACAILLAGCMNGSNPDSSVDGVYALNKKPEVRMEFKEGRWRSLGPKPGNPAILEIRQFGTFTRKDDYLVVEIIWFGDFNKARKDEQSVMYFKLHGDGLTEDRTEFYEHGGLIHTHTPPAPRNDYTKVQGKLPPVDESFLPL